MGDVIQYSKAVEQEKIRRAIEALEVAQKELAPLVEQLKFSEMLAPTKRAIADTINALSA